MGYYPIPPSTDGSAAPAGSVGEVIKSNVSAALGSGFTLGQFGNITSIALTPGVWLISGSVSAVFLTSLTRNTMAISAFSANTTTDHVTGLNTADVPLGVTGALSGNACVVNFPVTITAAATIFLKAQLTGAVGDILTGSISAVRIR